MQTNTLVALVNVSEAKNKQLTHAYRARIRVNQIGDAAEYFVKDMYANTFEIENVDDKLLKYQEYFSWLGNQNNPPDFIIKHGDAIEVKKTIGDAASLSLNSSYPKDYLLSDDTRIIRDCVECEADSGGWTKKDMVYVVVTASTDEIQSLWIVYGDCYAASREVYLNPVNKIQSALSQTEGITLVDTNELAKVKKIDELGITDLRVRGMWSISSPRKVFSRFFSISEDKTIYCIMSKMKYDVLLEELNEATRTKLLAAYTISRIVIPNPNNPAENIDAVALLGSIT